MKREISDITSIKKMGKNIILFLYTHKMHPSFGLGRKKNHLQREKCAQRLEVVSLWLLCQGCQLQQQLLQSRQWAAWAWAESKRTSRKQKDTTATFNQLQPGSNRSLTGENAWVHYFCTFSPPWRAQGRIPFITVLYSYIHHKTALKNTHCISIISTNYNKTALLQLKMWSDLAMNFRIWLEGLYTTGSTHPHKYSLFWTSVSLLIAEEVGRDGPQTSLTTQWILWLYDSIYSLLNTTFTFISLCKPFK